MATEQTVKAAARPLMSPLNSDDETALRNILARKLSAHADHIQRCENCGLDMSSHRQIHDLQIQHAQAMLDHFFPPSVTQQYEP